MKVLITKDDNGEFYNFRHKKEWNVEGTHQIPAASFEALFKPFALKNGEGPVKIKIKLKRKK